MRISDWISDVCSSDLSLCDQIGTNLTSAASRLAIKAIIDLALSLDGLPPATFDIFLKIETRPQLGPLMLFQASPSGIEALIRLADGLPFCWATIPRRYWDAAAEAGFKVLIEAMPNSLELCAKAVVDRRLEIAASEPALAPLLNLSTRQPALQDAAQSFLNRSGDRIAEHVTSPFRPTFNLPDWKVSDHFFRDLDAPVVAALAAREAIRPNAEQKER